MGCCKCEEYSWEDPQEVMYSDSDGKEYCLFHAPVKKKGVSVGDFNELVSERIQAIVDLEDENARCNLSGTIFPGNICFAKNSTMPGISFYDARFKGSADFSDVQFKGSSEFSKTHFHWGAFFNDAHFGEVYFSDAHFWGNADFKKAHFGGDADFKKAHLFASAHFGDAEFGEGAEFYSVKFGGEADFSSVKFGGGADFSSAKFGSKGLFRYAKFGGEADFSFSLFGGFTTFLAVEFGGRADFNRFNASPNVSLFFGNCMISHAGITFRNCEPSIHCDFKSQYDLANIRFIDSPWEKDGRIKACTEDRGGQLQPTRDFYQRMKAKYKAENNEYEASKWHIAEKEAQLKVLAQRKDEQFNWFMLWLYKLVSGFGENPGRAFGVLACLLVVPLLFCSVDIEANFFGLTFHSHQVADPIAQWLKYIPLTRAMAGEPSSGWRAVMFFWQLLITLQAALFAFALRNNFRR